jgi:hypothetical protein
MLGLDTSVFAQGKDSLSVFLDKPFWIWDYYLHRAQYTKTNGHCCFNHLISLPTKGGRQYPMFDFQELIFDALEQNQNIWIKKARGIGLTTFMLRYLAWKILSSTELDHKSIYIASGTRDQTPEKVDGKLKKLFEKRFPLLKLESRFTDLWLKKTWIRILTISNIMDIEVHDIAYLFIDEADYLRHKQQEVLEHILSSYAEKANPKTIIASTPNSPGGLFEKIENDPTCRYTKLKLDYTYGLGTIYERKFIEKKRLESEFEREYNLRYEIR